MTLNDSLNKPTSVNGDKYGYWKGGMRIFIEGMDYDIWIVVKNGPFVHTHLVGSLVENKSREI